MRHLRPSYAIDAPHAIDAPRTQVWEEVEAAARTEIGAKKLKRLGEPKRTARKKWRAPNLQEEVEDMALTPRLFPNFSEAQVASTALSRRRIASTPSTWCPFHTGARFPRFGRGF